MKRLLRKLALITPAVARHFLTRDTRPYERILQYMRSKPDIWITSQGDYIQWWVERSQMTLRITVTAGVCQIEASSPRAVIEQVPGKFLQTKAVSCPYTTFVDTTFVGEVWITIDPALPQKELLIELLHREGIMNWRIAESGDFMLSAAEVGPLLAKITHDMQNRTVRTPGRPLEADVQAVRQLVMAKLAEQKLPLWRVWYHPQVGDVVPQAVFSPRYDVDRAITNLPRIRRLEQRYGVESTLYIRTFCPFYTGRDIQELARSPWCAEIALHGEFVTNARRFGSECAAAKAEKEHLEQLIDRPVLGVGMHGGELTRNASAHTNAAIHDAGLLYDTTPRPLDYYFPFRKVIGGHFNQSYGLAHALSDVEMPVSLRYGQRFYSAVVAMMEEIYHANGVFVLMLHPIYFGFFRYLSRPQNLFRLIRYMVKYLLGKTGSL